MVTNTEVADVLERAADLYESEQIDYCRGSWGTAQLYRGGQEVVGEFHCAEGAILRAAGFTMQQIVEAQIVGALWSLEDLMRTPVVLAAIRMVNRHVGAVSPRLFNYSDNLFQSSAKRTLIQVFKETAKELRNDS